MKIQPPQLPAEPRVIEDFDRIASLCLEEERPVEDAFLAEYSADRAAFPKLEIRRSILEGSAFLNCDLSGTSFVDVLFSGCNFSNTRLTDAYFSRCRFTGCKWVGADFGGAVLKQLTIENTNLRYASFDKARMQDILLTDCDLTETSVSEVKWKNFSASGCRFVRTSFFKTPLAGIDFTQNELLAPVLSSPPAELRGAKISLLQAADLIELFGVKVGR